MADKQSKIDDRLPDPDEDIEKVMVEIENKIKAKYPDCKSSYAEGRKLKLEIW